MFQQPIAPDNYQPSTVVSEGSFAAQVYARLTLLLGITFLSAQFLSTMPLFSQHTLPIFLVSFGIIFAIRFAGAFAFPLLMLFSVLMGAIVGVDLSFYRALPGGVGVIHEALAGTAAMLGGLTLYAWTTRRNFSHITGFLITGLIVGLVVSLANIFFFHLAALQLAMAGVFALVFSGLILVDTQRIRAGGEYGENATMLVASLYMDIINLFLSLLQIFGGASRE